GGGGGGGGGVATTVARSIDAAPTLLALAGLPPLAGAEGRSLEPALRGESMSDAPAYAESLYARLRLGWAPLYAWRTATLKLVEAPQPELYALDDAPGEPHAPTAGRAEAAAGLRSQLRLALASEAPVAAAQSAPETAERLRALGYVGGGAGAPAHPSLRDPKDGIALLRR